MMAQNIKSLTDTAKSYQKILIGGRVEDDYLKLADVAVSLIRNSKILKKIITNDNGEFIFQLQPDNEYFLEINKEGYASKKIYISTYEMPDNLDINWTTGIVVDLFKNDLGLNVSILRNPIGKIYYFQDKKTLDYDRDYTRSIQDELDSLQFELNKKRELIRKQEAQRLAEEKRRQQQLDEENERKRKEDELKARVMAQNLERQKKSEKISRDSTYRANKAQQLADSKKKFVQEHTEKQNIEKLIKHKNDSLMRDRLIHKKLEEEKQQKALQALAEKKKLEQGDKNRVDSIRFANTREAYRQRQEETITAINKAKVENTAYDVNDNRPKINLNELKGLNANDSIVKMMYFKSDSSGLAEESAKASFNRKLSTEEKEKFFVELQKNYPIGVSLEEDVYPGFKIKRIIAVNKDMSCEYKIIEFNFGSFFKRNDYDLTEANFKKEVYGFDEYFKK
jgi:hypothetical protein